VDGGASANNLLMQMQADFAGLAVDRPKNLETTAFGAALFAGLGAGIYKSLGELKSLRVIDRQFEPNDPKVAKKDEVLAGWRRAIKAVQVFAGTIKD
jgi:glycerol kinase